MNSQSEDYLQAEGTDLSQYELCYEDEETSINDVKMDSAKNLEQPSTKIEGKVSSSCTGHTDLEGNEKVDELAHAGALGEAVAIDCLRLFPPSTPLNMKLNDLDFRLGIKKAFCNPNGTEKCRSVKIQLFYGNSFVRRDASQYQLELAFFEGKSRNSDLRAAGQ